MQISLYSPKGAISALSEFLRRKYDDKYTIFGCESVTLEVIYLPNGSWKFSNLVGISLVLEKESIAHFSAFLANCLGGRPNFGGSKW
jgi:hypothetical protein